MPVAEIRSVAPEMAIAALRQREASLPRTWSWTDMWQEEHRRAFTVAKSAGFDILGDVFGALEKALTEGQSFETFQKSLRPVLEAKGWWGRKEMADPADPTGERRLVQLGSTRRLKTIFDTNMRVSHAAGKWERFQRTKKLLPYLKYSAILDGRTRPLHRRWGGGAGVPVVVLPVDHEWWNTHFPPNGWHCRCTVVALTEGQVKRMGLDPANLKAPPIATTMWRNPKTGQRIRVPNGIDPGFGYNPGRSPLDAQIPRRKLQAPPDELLSVPWKMMPQMPTGAYPGNSAYPQLGRPPLPPARVIDDALKLPAGLSAEEYVAAFLQPFGATPTQPAIHIDPAGMPLTVGRAMFIDPHGSVKTAKGARGYTMAIMAEAVLRPQEIWVEVDEARRIVRRYLLRYVFRSAPDADEEAGLAVFAATDDGWSGVTTFPIKDKRAVEERRDYIDRRVRRGFLVWRE